MELLYKNRSVTSCLKTAYNMFLSNFKGISHAMWLLALLNSILVAVLVTMLVADDNIAVFSHEHHAAYVGILAVVGIASILTGAWALARLMSFLNEKPRRWNLKRMMVAVIVTLLAAALLVAVMAFAVHLMFIQGDASSHVVIKTVVLVMIAVLLAVVVMPLIFINMRYMNDERKSYPKSFIEDYKTGMKNVGFLLVAAILSGLIATVIMAVVLMPIYVLFIAKAISSKGVDMGDPADMPEYLMWMVLGTMILAGIVVWLILIYETLVCYFLYGAVDQRQRERQESQSLVTADHE